MRVPPEIQLPPGQTAAQIVIHSFGHLRPNILTRRTRVSILTFPRR